MSGVSKAHDGTSWVPTFPGVKGDPGEVGPEGPQGESGVAQADAPITYDEGTQTVGWDDDVAVAVNGVEFQFFPVSSNSIIGLRDHDVGAGAGPEITLNGASGALDLNSSRNGGSASLFSHSANYERYVGITLNGETDTFEIWRSPDSSTYYEDSIVGSPDIKRIVQITQAAYDALDPADPDVLYVVVD